MLLAYLVRVGIGALISFPALAASVNVFLSPPGVQDTAVTGAEKENFDGLSIGIKGSDFVTGVGTYRLSSTSALMIQAGDQYGGAGGTQYSAFGKQSSTVGSVQLDLLGARTYFGFWWSAVDPFNTIQLYSAGSFIGQITRDDIVAFLPGNNSVSSIGGTSHSSATFYGHPTTGENPGEVYAYIHFVATGVTFDRLVFFNPFLGTGFEADNLAARAAAPTPTDDWIPFREIPVTIAGSQIPEPSTMGLAALALGSIILRRGRKSVA